MRVAAVESSTIATVAYEEASQLLQLEFCSGAVYLYFNVPAAVHEELLGAVSKGRYFNHVIRRRFRYRVFRGGETLPEGELARAGAR